MSDCNETPMFPSECAEHCKCPQPDKGYAAKATYVAVYYGTSAQATALGFSLVSQGAADADAVVNAMKLAQHKLALKCLPIGVSQLF